jgi:hypothetical protein
MLLETQTSMSYHTGFPYLSDFFMTYLTFRVFCEIEYKALFIKLVMYLIYQGLSGHKFKQALYLDHLLIKSL